ncbi:hypothetical protein HS088_TW11G00772 [Tripterygium wilfordii]|uniref:DPH4 homolog n=1 Tax=Tripterygium wilfordii TaxID=458696 RepID=A0A7J7D2X3_TRIWF|nr:DPH4 homolog [Tripterygium wilfordii]XP_038716145.1 DPH4 homolog [Tripterygium wilfordii]KAF5740695.1 hypothetical protein HS088_TW11G00772 [Tripterygium wilfordii]
MLVSENSIQESYYGILSVREDANYEEIRASYRSAILNFHPDKLQQNYDKCDPSHDTGDKFLKVQKAWEVLSNSVSRAVYDNELQASREENEVAEDIDLQDMLVEVTGEVLELFYPCRCGDYFNIDSFELGKMGYTLLQDGSSVSFQATDALPASLVLPCGSCSLQVRLLIDVDIEVPTDDKP